MRQPTETFTGINSSGLTLEEYVCGCECHGGGAPAEAAAEWDVTWWVEVGRESPRCCEQKPSKTGRSTHIRVADF